MRAGALFERAAERTANATRAEQENDLIEPVTDQIRAQHAHSANLAVMRTASDMQKHVIDILV